MIKIPASAAITAEDKAEAKRAATRNAINAERQRRIEQGVTVDGIPIMGRDVDQINMLALKDTARDLLAAGVTDAIVPFRDGENNDHMLTPEQVINIVDVGKRAVQHLYTRSWELKQMDPLPENVTDDELWT